MKKKRKTSKIKLPQLNLPHRRTRPWRSLMNRTLKKLEMLKKRSLNQAMRTKGSHKTKVTMVKMSLKMRMITMPMMIMSQKMEVMSKMMNLRMITKPMMIMSQRMEEMPKTLKMMKPRMDLTQNQQALMRMIEKMLKMTIKKVMLRRTRKLMKEVSSVVMLLMTMRHQKR